MQSDWLARMYFAAPSQTAPPEEVDKLRKVIRVAIEMAVWLIWRYVERANAASNVDMLERALAMEGRGPPPGAAHRAIVFADLTGYTALTIEFGDEEAAMTLGLSPGRLRFLAFTVAAFGTGLAGVLYVPLFGFVSPYAFRSNR